MANLPFFFSIMAKTIVAIYDVLVFALLVTMYFTDPEQGGELFAVILFFTILYNLYFWLLYWVASRLVKKQKVRKWIGLALALLPFIPVSVVVLRTI